MMGQPAFAFAIARTGMSASRGIETLRDCEIRDGDLQLLWNDNEYNLYCVNHWILTP